MPKSGDYFHKIEIKALEEKLDKFNKQVSATVPVFSARCNVKILSGAEQIKAGVDITTENLSIKMRPDRRLKHKQFVSWEDNLYTIDLIRPSDDRKRSEIIVIASREF